jgi:hypothetical protein
MLVTVSLLSGVKRTARHTSLPDYDYRHDHERRFVSLCSGLVSSGRSKPLKELKLTTFNARAENEQTHWGTSPEG